MGPESPLVPPIMDNFQLVDFLLYSDNLEKKGIVLCPVKV